MRAGAGDDTPTLPEDPAALRALLLEALSKRGAFTAERDSIVAERDTVAQERDALAAQNERLRHLLLKLTVVRCTRTRVAWARRAATSARLV